MNALSHQSKDVTIVWRGEEKNDSIPSHFTHIDHSKSVVLRNISQLETNLVNGGSLAQGNWRISKRSVMAMAMQMSRAEEEAEKKEDDDVIYECPR